MIPHAATWACLFGVAMLSGCVPFRQEPAPASTSVPAVQVIVSVASPAVSGLPLYVGVQEGLFRAHGVELSMQQMPGNVGQTALLKKEIQFLSSPTDSIAGAANGLPFKIVYSTWERAPWTLVGKSELATLDAVRGKTVGTNRPGTSPYSYLEAGVRQAGLSMSDFTILFLPATQDDYAALVAGQVDAAVLSPPFDLQAEAAGFHEIAFLGNNLQVPYVGLATSFEYIQDHRPVVTNVIRGMLDATDWLPSHPDGGAAYIQQYLGVSPDIARAAYQKMIGSLSTTGETQPEGIKQQISMLSAALNRAVELDPDSTVDFGPLHEARASR